MDRACRGLPVHRRAGSAAAKYRHGSRTGGHGDQTGTRQVRFGALAVTFMKPAGRYHGPKKRVKEKWAAGTVASDNRAKDGIPIRGEGRPPSNRMVKDSLFDRLPKKAQMQGGARCEARGVVTRTPQRHASARVPILKMGDRRWAFFRFNRPECGTPPHVVVTGQWQPQAPAGTSRDRRSGTGSPSCSGPGSGSHRPSA